MSSWNENPATIYNQYSQIVMVDTSEILTVSSTAQNVGVAGSKFYIILPFIIVGLLICATAGIVTAVNVVKNADSTTNASTTATTTLTSGGISITNASTTIPTTVPTTTIQTLIWNSTGITVAGVTGVNGVNGNQLYYPFGALTGTTVAGQPNGTAGSNSSYFTGRSNLFVDSSGNMYITDTGNARVQLWASSATSGTTIAGITGSPGSANNELDYPYSVVRDASSGTIYIADYNNHRIMQYLSGASSGTVISGGNGPGTNSTQLYGPVSIYLETSSNSFIICNNGANSIVRWVIGATSWTLVAGDISGTADSTSTLLNYPIGLAVDYMSNIYIADALNYRVQFFLAGQLNATTIAGVTGTSGSSATLFTIPYAVTLDSQLNLYVADSPNNRVQKFLRY